jgi:hypothetical protein
MPRCPANALADVRGERLGGQPGGLRNIDIGRVPAQLLHAQGGMRVFGDGLGGDAAGFVERRAADDRAGAAEEGGVPEVVAVLDDAVEQLALVGDGLVERQIALEGVGRIEVVRGLQHGQPLLGEEPAQRELQEAARGNVVAVEDGDERGAHLRQRVVDVAGLSVKIVLARDVADPGLLGEEAEVLAAAVVKDVDVELFGRVVDVDGGQGGVADQRERLVVGGDKDVDVGPVGFAVGQRHGSAPQRKAGLQVAEHHDERGVDLGGEQDQHEQGIERNPVVGLVGEEVGDHVDAPPAVAQGGRD